MGALSELKASAREEGAPRLRCARLRCTRIAAELCLPLGILAISFALRAWIVRNTPAVELDDFGGISNRFATWADAVARGELFPAGITYMPLTSWLYGGLVWLLGHDAGITAGRFLQAALDAAASVGLYLLGGMLLGRTAGALAGLVHATTWEFASSSVTVLPEATLVFWVTASLTTFTFGLRFEKHRMLSWLLCGAALAGGYYTRCELLFLPAFLAAWCLLFSLDRPIAMRLQHAVPILIVFVLLLVPWLLHTKAAAGQFRLTTVGTGQTIWQGLGEATNPYGFVLDDEFMANYLKSKNLGSMELIPFALKHPLYLSYLFVARTQKTLFKKSEYSPRLKPRILDRLPWMKKGCLQGLLVFGLALLFFEPGKTLILFLPLVYYSLIYGVVHHEGRHVIPGHLTYCLLWGAAAGVALQALLLPRKFLFGRRDVPTLAPAKKEGLTVLKIAGTAVALALVLRGASYGLDRFTKSEQAKFLALVSGEGGPPPAIRLSRTMTARKGEPIEVALAKLQTLEPCLLVVRGTMESGQLLARLILEENDTRDLVRLDGRTCCLLYYFGTRLSLKNSKVELWPEPAAQDGEVQGAVDVRVYDARTLPLHYTFWSSHVVVRIHDR